MTTLRAVVLGFLGGLTFSALGGCGTKPACDCPDGCCDEAGACVAGTVSSACGLGGAACVACGADQRCVDQACVGASDAGTDAGTDAGSVDLGGVVVNEVALNGGDFFELYNAGSTSVDLSGFKVADLNDSTGGPKLLDALTLPSGTTLAPGAFLLFLEGTVGGKTTSCGDAGVASCFLVTFGLSYGSGDALFILDSTNTIRLRTDVAAGVHATGKSWGRLPDGTGAFTETERTPGQPNVRAVIIDAGADAGTDAGTADAGLEDAGLEDAGLEDAGLVEASFVVVRVGPAADGGTLSNASAPVQLEWRGLSSGAVLKTVALPTADVGAQHAFAVSGSATSEGLLAHGGGFWTLAGYGAAPGLASVNSTAGLARVVARVDEDGGVDTSTAISDAYLGNNVRAAATFDGTGFWLAGTASSSAGVRYAGLGWTTSADVFSGVLNIRAVKVFDNQLYASTAADAGAGVPRVFAVGAGLPMAATTSVTPLDGVGVLATGDFALLDSDGAAGPEVLYVVDTGAGVGVRRFTRAGSSWVEASSLQPPATVSCMGVAARAGVDGGAPFVLCTGTDGVVYRWDDDGGAPAATSVVTAPTGTMFRGLGF